MCAGPILMFLSPLVLFAAILVVAAVVVVVVGPVSVVVLELVVGLPHVVVVLIIFVVFVMSCTPLRLAILEIAAFSLVALPFSRLVTVLTTSPMLVPLITSPPVMFASLVLPCTLLHASLKLVYVMSSCRCCLLHDSPLWGWVQNLRLVRCHVGRSIGKVLALVRLSHPLTIVGRRQLW